MGPSTKVPGRGLSSSIPSGVARERVPLCPSAYRVCRRPWREGFSEERFSSALPRLYGLQQLVEYPRRGAPDHVAAVVVEENRLRSSLELPLLEHARHKKLRDGNLDDLRDLRFGRSELVR